MKAVSLLGPKQCRVVERPIPEGDGEGVIIKVTACGICGSDLHLWKHRAGMDLLPGLIMGHEFSGFVHDPGNRTDLMPGDRVTAIPINPCGNCDPCVQGFPCICREAGRRALPGLNSPGAYAQYCMVRSDMVRKLPDSVSDIEAALVEPASVALHAVHQADIRPGQNVLISGGGPVGLLCAMWSGLEGASHVVLSEINPFRIQFAEKTDYITEVHDAGDARLARALKKSTGGFDRVVETSASEEGIRLGLTTLKHRGRIVLAGISYTPQKIPTLVCTLKEAEIKTAFGYTISEFESVLDCIGRHKPSIEHLITRTVSLDQVQISLEKLSSELLEDIKIMIRPW